MTIEAHAIPRLPRGVRLREDKVRGRWVLLGPERIFEIDGIGVEILKRCDGIATFNDIVTDLSQSFQAEIALVERDVDAFIAGLNAKRIVDL